MKDIHNIGTATLAMDSKKNKDASEMDKGLKDHYPSLETSYLVEEHVMTGIFLQDSEMKNTFERYPEVILLDATHKTNNLQMPLYVMLAIDGNGESQVVCAFLVYDETESTLRSMVAIFKNCSLEWKNIEVFIITNKDMTERYY